MKKKKAYMIVSIMIIAAALLLVLPVRPVVRDELPFMKMRDVQ